MQRDHQQPLTTQPHMQWNLGGWLGSTLGGTLWMLVAAVYLVAAGQAKVAAISLGICLATWVLAGCLWARRAELSPYKGLMILLGWLAIAIPVLGLLTEALTPPRILAQMQWPDTLLERVVLALVVPALMLQFTLSSRR